MGEIMFVETGINLDEGYTDYHCPRCSFTGKIEHELLALDTGQVVVLTCPDCGFSRRVPITLELRELANRAERQARCAP